MNAEPVNTTLVETTPVDTTYVTQPDRPVRDWREAAMHKALRAQDRKTAFLIRDVRRRAPGAALLILHCERDRLIQFLREESAAQPILGGNVHYANSEDVLYREFLGWYRALWDGTPIEVALLPGIDPHEPVLCMAESEAALQAFNRAACDYVERPVGRALRYAETWEAAPDLDAELGKVTWEDIVLPPDTLRGLRETVESFIAHRDAFSALGFPWRRGMLLVGPPGTGKTMICKAAASALSGLPFLYVRDLRERLQHEAVEDIFRRARKLAPCLLVFEDLDGLINSHNRSMFLNEIDGFADNEGLFIIASSNHPGQIDEALLKRPSRFDRVFHIGLPGLDERRAYCLHLFQRSSLAARLAPSLDIEALAASIAARSDGFTPAYLKEAFTAAALQRAQHGASILDGAFADAVLAQVEELRAHLKRAKKPEALGEMDSGDDIIGLRRSR